MADKNIRELPEAEELEDESLLAVSQRGTAMKLTGKKFRSFAEAALSKFIQGAGYLLTIGKVTTGEAGTEAKVTNSGTAQEPVLDITIPRGEKGDKGEKGDPGGVSSVNGQAGAVTVTKEDVGLGNVPNVGTDDQTPTFTEAESRENIESGETVSTLFGKIKKWFSDMAAVAFSGKYSDLTGTPTIPAAVRVKGNAESAYRTGDVNLTPANIGALPISGGTLTGDLKVGTGNNKLDVGNKAQVRTDGEGGNVVIRPPDSYTNVATKWEIDAFNGNLRIGHYGTGEKFDRSPLVLNADGSGTFTGTSNKAKAPMVTEISLSQDIALLPSGFYHVEGIIAGNNYPPGIKDHYWGIYIIVMAKEEYKDMNADDITDLRILSVQNGELYFGARNHSKTLVWNKIGLTRV